jgi:hypothetical protein
MSNPLRSLSVLFMTAAQPSGCQDNTTIAAAAVAQMYVTGTPPIKTYVLGVGPDTGNLDSIAAAGGPAMAYMATNGGAPELANAFAAIRKSTQTCDYNVPRFDGGTTDPNKVNVQIRIGTGGTARDIYYVERAAICSDTARNPTGEGWYYDNPPPGAPTKISLCPNSCTPLQVMDGSAVNVVLGCKTRPFPPPN